jgi:phosphopantothenoylcysteine synthetase/decarboxylase
MPEPQDPTPADRSVPRPWVVFASGATIETAMLPYHLLRLSTDFGLRLSAAISPGAKDFVTLPVLGALTRGVVYHENTQTDPGSGLPIHLVWNQADLLVLYPASARILAQCAQGEITCAVTRLFAFMPKTRIVVAPSLHPEMERSLYQGHVSILKGIGCTVLAEADYWASWRDVEDAVVEALKLSRFRAPRRDVRLDKIFG